MLLNYWLNLSDLEHQHRVHKQEGEQFKAHIETLQVLYEVLSCSASVWGLKLLVFEALAC